MYRNFFFSRLAPALLCVLLLFPCSFLAQSKKLVIGDYGNIDQYALNVPPSQEISMDSLAGFLGNLGQTSQDKARAVFRWITNNIEYDAEGFFAGEMGDITPEEVLKNKKTVCEGYAGLFENLAHKAGLEVATINGYSKGYYYSVGKVFGGKPNHSWNALNIDGQWFLVDCTWGTGYLDDQKRFVRRFEPHYFLTPPEEFIYDHYPLESKWQLIEKPLGQEEYQKLVYLRPAFWSHGIKLDSHTQNLIRTENRVEITFSVPTDVLLRPRLLQNDTQLEESLTFLQRSGEKYEVFAVFPSPGTYVVRIYTKRKQDPGVFDWALDYRVDASAAPDGPFGFPETLGTFHQRDVFLYNPLEGHLKAAMGQVFKLSAPQADSVSVVSGGDWYDLSKDGDLFQGEVPIQAGDIEVYAKYPEFSDYDCLLKYTAQ